ncbi:MAG: hypothetical protein ACRCV9_07545, partial [Burkholderiaceae bacterium]
MARRSDVALLAALLLAVALPNYGYAPAAALLGGAESRWQYLLEGFALLPSLALVALMWRRPVVWAVCAWGAGEGLLKGVCGALRLHDAEFAPGGYVCQAGEAWTIVGTW